MSATYFWYRDKLVVFEKKLFAQAFEDAPMHKYRYCPCVDAFNDQADMRYGIWVQNDRSRHWSAEWEPRPFQAFPAAFRAHLLLLEVS